MKKKLKIPFKSWKVRLAALVALPLFLTLCVWAAKFAHSMYRWQTHEWAAAYWTASDPDPDIPDKEKHLIFLMVDHYEHGGPNNKRQGALQNKDWCEKFREISDRFQDNYGNKFRYTWFYPFDHKNEAIVEELSRMARDGYGEIELHWHLTRDSGVTNDNFGEMLEEAIDWFQQFGAFITDQPQPKTAFAYIAGVWDLDASRPGPQCHGVTNQIGELFRHGCYADFTFSTIGTPAQPHKINAIYYANDDPTKPKSHDWGENVAVGKPVHDKLMIFQGPIAMSCFGDLEYGAVENDPRFSPDRVDQWIDADIHVTGRPEWVFVKVYSHGAQSQATVLEHDMAWMLETLENRCNARGISLHFATAREAYNIVKAAEAGKVGNPEEYRNFVLPPYLNCRTDNSTSFDHSLELSP